MYDTQHPRITAIRGRGRAETSRIAMLSEHLPQNAPRILAAEFCNVWMDYSADRKLAEKLVLGFTRKTL